MKTDNEEFDRIERRVAELKPINSSGKIHVFGPEGGEKLEELDFEDSRVTNVAFGGPEHTTLYVTESGLGRVVCLPWRRPGMILFPDR